jgi:hypothetical protein
VADNGAGAADVGGRRHAVLAKDLGARLTCRAAHSGGRMLTGRLSRHSTGGAVQMVLTSSKFKRFNLIQIPPNFDRFKRYIPVLQNFEIKYGLKVHEIRNNFPYTNFLRFRMDFELKF